MEQIFLLFCSLWLACSAMSPQDYYNVLASQDFEIFKSASVPRAVHFLTKTPDKLKKDWQMKEFMTNFMDAGRYLVNFDIKFATIDCTSDPVQEYCSTDKAKDTLFVFRYNHVLTELPMDALYNVDAIVSNMLHLVLLREVPFIQEPADLAAMQERLKGRKDILFAKVLAVGTSEHRAFMEGAFAYSHLYQFVMTTNMATSMLGPGSDEEWKEAKNRVWLLNCKSASTAEPCHRSFYRSKLSVPDFALYLKVLDLRPYIEYKVPGETIFFQKFGVPTAYVYSNSHQYEDHKEMVRSLAQTYRGNLGFVLVNSDSTPESVVADRERCRPPCLMLQRAPEESLIRMGGDLTVENIRAFIEDKMYVEEEPMDTQDDQSGFPAQEVQDDEVQFAVHRDTRVLDTSHVAKLTDQTFPEFVAGTELVMIVFTIRWDPRCNVFLESYSAAAKTIQQDVGPGRLVSPVAQVECSNWPDVCQLNNVTTYPVIKTYRDGRKVADYKGSLSEEGILKAYRLLSTDNPMVLQTCADCLSLSKGWLPSWSASTLNAVVVGFFPEMASKERAEYEQAAKMLQGQQLIAVCQKNCAELARSGANIHKPTVTAYKWQDSHQPFVEYSGDFTAGDLTKFVHTATLPLVPELTPSTFPLLFTRGKPLLILFKDTDDQSKEAEGSFASLAREKTFETELTIVWIDVSQPSCIGSEILKDYGIRRQARHPSIVFVDHKTSRVCNYPPDFSLKVSAMADWLVIVLNGETTCSGLREDKFEPMISPYDYLAFLRDANKDRFAHRLGRLPTDHHRGMEEEGEEEDEEEGAEFEDSEGRDLHHVSNARMEEHRHTEL